MIKYHRTKKESKNWKIILTLSGSLILLTLIISWFVVGITLAETRRLLLHVVDDNNSNKALYDTISQSFLLIARDSNEIRSYLGYSQKEYPVLNYNSQQEDATEDTTVFFDALRKIYQTNNVEKNRLLFDQFVKNNEFLNLIQAHNLQTINPTTFSYELFQGWQLYLTLNLQEETSLVELIPFTGKSSEFTVADKAYLQAVANTIDRMQKHHARLATSAEALCKVMQAPEFTGYLQEHSLILIASPEDFLTITFRLEYEKMMLLSFGVDKKTDKFFVNNQQFSKATDLPARVKSVINNLDLSSAAEKKLSGAQRSIREIFNDKAFKALLESYALQVNPESHADAYFEYFDILQQSKERIGTFAIDKLTGEIYITDKDEIQICALKSLLDQQDSAVKKKIEIPAILPAINEIYNNSEGLTFLVCGSNEKNTDTMIVVNVDAHQKSVTMLGLPRDLYHRGRRINTVYYEQNAEQFLKEISEITGLLIEKYIHIDMFAFIEVVNILGGLDVTLQYDLIDPSYKIKENGKWETLNYKRGTHHLNGVQALRVARSRNYTSDFDRSRRQQQILLSVGNKFKELGFSNLDKISSLVQVLLKYVRTNFSVFELVQYFNKYKDFSISAQHTLDTNNVLDATYTNIYYLTQHDQKFVIDENFDKGGWILVPRENDWNLIKWYIRELIEPENALNITIDN